MIHYYVFTLCTDYNECKKLQKKKPPAFDTVSKGKDETTFRLTLRALYVMQRNVMQLM